MSRVRPLPVFSQRLGELLDVFNSEDTCEWIDVECVEDADSLQLPEPSMLENSVPIISNVESWIADGIRFVEDTLLS